MEAIERSDKLYDAGDFRGAVEVLTDAIGVLPTEPALYAERGFIYRSKKGWRKAIADFDIALSHQPDAPTTLFMRGTCRATIGEFDGAIEDLQRCLVLQPNSADAYWELGTIYTFKNRDLAAAIASYEKAFELDPEGHPGLPQEISELRAKLAK